MSTQPQDPFEGTALAYFRANNIKGFIYGVYKDPKHLWILLARPWYLEVDQACQSQLQRIDWITEYNKNRDTPLNDLMNAYVLHTPKLREFDIDVKTLSNQSSFNCELAKALDTDFSKDFASMISKLMSIVMGYISLVFIPAGTEHRDAAYEKVEWIISELLPTLFIWIIEVHIERTTLPIYADRILNYITQVFLLLQAETYVIEAEKMMELRKQFITEEQDRDNNKKDFISAVNATLTSKLDFIDDSIKKIIESVNTDSNLTDSERNVTLAAIYDLRYKTDKSLVENNTYFSDKPNDYNRLTMHYRQWLENVNEDCKMVNNLPKDGNAGTYVKDRICTHLGGLTRKSIDPASINKSGKYPVTPAVTS
jgi:hypothetical protein